MFRKLAVMMSHPYAAPLVEPVKGIFRIAKAPISDFIVDAHEGWTEAREDESRLVSVYSHLFREGYGSTGFLSTVGAAICAIGLGITGGMLAGGSVPAIVGAVALGIGTGVAAGPFVAAGVLATAAAVVGSVVGGVPGFIKGIGKVFDYHKNRAAYDQALRDLPAQMEKDALAKRVAPALAKFNDLAQKDREPFVQMMVEEYAGAFYGQSEKIARQIEALPDYERKRLAGLLKDKLKDAFTIVTPAPAPVVSTPAPAVVPDDDPDGIVAPRTASFRRHHTKTAAATTL